VDRLSGNVCVRMIFDNCYIKLRMVLQSGIAEIPLYERSYPVRDFNKVFQTDMCANQLGCTICLKWTNLELTSSIARGCGTITFTCAGVSLGTYPLDCFSDTQVLPTCLGKCPGDCSGHGTCDKGLCYCSPQYSGDDCATANILCGQDSKCSDHGTCTNGGCVCSSDYTGNDCSVDTTFKAKASPVSVVAIIVPICFVGAVIAGIAVIYYIKKRRDATPKFNQFDLMEEETTSLGLEEEDVKEPE